MCSQNMDWYIVSAREALVAILVISTVMLSSWIKKVGPSADEWIRKLWYIYTMEYYSAIKKNTFESVLMR